jgi:hypothetical protein
MRRTHFPPERNQVPAHLTLFHHLPPGLAPELDRRLAYHAAGPRPRATIPDVISLGAGTAFQVESAELEEIRADLANAFRGLLIPQDQAGWRPHITIQNKVEPKEATRHLPAAPARHQGASELALSRRTLGAGEELYLQRLKPNRAGPHRRS